MQEHLVRALRTLNIENVSSVNVALNRTNDWLSRNCGDRYTAADTVDQAISLMTMVGVEHKLIEDIDNPVALDVMVKSVVEKLVELGPVDFDAQHAVVFGRAKIEKLKRSMPWLFKDAALEPKENKGDAVKTQTRTKGVRNDKNKESLEMVREMAKAGETDRGVITTKVAASLGVEYANAYFYVKKAEKELKLTLTATKGRKASKKAS